MEGNGSGGGEVIMYTHTQDSWEKQWEEKQVVFTEWLLLTLDNDIEWLYCSHVGITALLS